MVRSRHRSERAELIELLARLTGEPVPENDKLRRLIRILVAQRDALRMQILMLAVTEQKEDEMKVIAQLNAIIATYQQVTGWSPELVAHYATCDQCVPICGNEEEICDLAQYAIYVLTYRLGTTDYKCEFRTHQDLLTKLEEVQFDEQTEAVQVAVRYVTIGEPDFNPSSNVNGDKERV